MNLLLVMSLLVVAGLALFLCAVLKQRKLLKNAVPSEEDVDHFRKLAFQPFQEFLLCFVFTFAGFFFARKLIGGNQAQLVALGIAGLLAILSATGSCNRFRQMAEEALENFPEPLKNLLFWQKINCAGICCFLLGLLTGLAHLSGFSQV